MPHYAEPPFSQELHEYRRVADLGKRRARRLGLGERGEYMSDVYLTSRRLKKGHAEATKDAQQAAIEKYGVPPWAISIAMQVLWFLLKRIWERRRRKQEESR
ncbi:MAG: hypothetical protein AAGA92_16170 [Planctomycetota bacterium]